MRRTGILKQYSFQFLIFLALSSCLTPIDYPVEIKGGTIVVNGQISTISDQNIIQLGRTANIARLPFPISGATIKLYDDVGSVHEYEEDYFNEGTYYLKDVTGVEGRTYYIQINLPDGGTYKSLPEKMPEPAIQESVNYKIVRKELTDSEGSVVKQDNIEIFSNSTITPSKEPIYLKWGVEETFLLSPTDFPDPFGVIPPSCFISQNTDPQRIVLFDGSEVSTTSINNLLVANRMIDWSFLERHYFTVYQSSITKDAYDYWSKVNIVANQVGTIFDTPPATIIGNIIREGDPNEKTLGYFQASNQKFNRFFLLPTDLPFSLSVETCVFDGSFNSLDYPTRCIDCSSVRNSSYNRPDWF